MIPAGDKKALSDAMRQSLQGVEPARIQELYAKEVLELLYPDNIYAR